MPRQDRLSLFTDGSQPRVRRSGDAVVALVASLVLVVLAMVAHPSSHFETAMIGLIDSAPGWFDFLWRFAIVLVLSWIVVVLGGSVWSRRFSVARDLVAAVLLATAMGFCTNRIISGNWTSGLVVFGADPTTSFPPMAISAAAAVIAVAAPHLRASYRRLGRWLLAGAVLGSLMLGSCTPVGALIALVIAIVSASLVHLGLGTDTGVPSPDEVTRTMAELGCPISGLTPATRQTAGMYTLDGVGADGRELLVKVYGRDARDSQALVSAWRGLWYRGHGSRAVSRTQQVEHEAFVSLSLGSRSVPVPEVVLAGGHGDGDAVLVLTGRGRPFTEVRDELGEDQLNGCWDLLNEAHRAGFALGPVGFDTFAIRGGGPDPEGQDAAEPAASIIFDRLLGATSAPTDEDRRLDEAQVLAMSVVVLGQDAALAVALRHLGADRLAAVLPYLQPAALDPSLRSEMRSRKLKLAEVRDAAAEAASVEPPEMAKLRRVSGGALIRTALLTLVAYVIITDLAKVDLSQIVDTFKGADWSWVVIALVLAQFAIAAQAVTTQGASPRRIPYGPLSLLQFAVAFIMLVIPSSAARIAMVVRFFQRHGVGAGPAVSISLLDSFTGFLVQVSVLLLTLGVGIGGVHLDLKLSSASSTTNSGTLVTVLIVAAVLLVGMVIAALALPKARSWVIAKIKGPLEEMWVTAKSVRTPRRLGQLFGGSLASQMLFAVSLGACVLAFGGSGVDLADMLVVYIMAALFGGFMPVPGGIGVMEAALVVGLGAVGVANAAAVGAAITFRLVSFYLPPVWGAAAFGWLRRSGDL